jgi:MFS transporter, CP family, cyanate transporter
VRAQIGRSSSRQPGPPGAGRSAPKIAAGAGAGLLLAGILALAANMRTAITSLPPLFPQLHGTLHLSTAGQAVLAAIPVLCFGVFSGSGAPLARRYGEERVLGAALVALAAGLLLRAAAPGVLLFPGTVIAGGSIALLNVLTPSLVKRRQPHRAGLLIGLYLLSLSAGAVVASEIAVPIFQGTGGGEGSIRLTLGLWAVPALLAAAVWSPQLRFRTLNARADNPPELNARGDNPPEPPGPAGGSAVAPGGLADSPVPAGFADAPVPVAGAPAGR